jgi:hypothetical protein
MDLTIKNNDIINIKNIIEQYKNDDDFLSEIKKYVDRCKELKKYKTYNIQLQKLFSTDNIEIMFLDIHESIDDSRKIVDLEIKFLNHVINIHIVIKQDFWKNPEICFISYNTKNNFFIPKKLFYCYSSISLNKLVGNFYEEFEVKVGEKIAYCYYEIPVYKLHEQIKKYQLDGLDDFEPSDISPESMYKILNFYTKYILLY